MAIVPFVIGFLTVYLTRTSKVKNGVAAFFWPWVTSAIILVITLLTNMEGVICWIMIFPFFAIVAGLGGLLAYHVKHKNGRVNEDQDVIDGNIFKENGLVWVAALLIPVCIGSIEGDRALREEVITISESHVINASKEKIWENIVNNKQSEFKDNQTWISRTIGFPKHLNTTLDKIEVGGRRMSYYERGLYFEEIIKEFEENKKLVFEVNTDPLKIPPTVWMSIY